MLLFVFNLIRAPLVRQEAHIAEVKRLNGLIETKKRATTPADWAALRAEFERYGNVNTSALDWLCESSGNCCWRYRGFGYLDEFESFARRGVRMAINSPYCQAELDIALPDEDPIQGWAELIRRVVQAAYHEQWTNQYVGDELKQHEAGTIRNAFQASILLCMKLESREQLPTYSTE